jgi:hypothetical protein
MHIHMHTAERIAVHVKLPVQRERTKLCKEYVGGMQIWGHIYIHIPMYTPIYMCIIYIFKKKYTCTQYYMYVCMGMYICMYVYVCIYIYVSIYIGGEYVYMDIYICIYVYISIDGETRTASWSSR